MLKESKQHNQRRAIHRAKAVEFLGGKCVSCGSTDKLEFDHIDNDRQGDQYKTISFLSAGSWERLLVELEKCQLLCKPCHIQKTIKENGWGKLRHGVLATYTNKKCRCDRCRAANADYMRKYALSGVN